MVIELFSPGLIAPGTIGVISFLLGLYGTAQLPVTAAGVLLLVFGVAMIIAEAHLPTHGILGASGVAALIASGLVLYDTNTSAFEISPLVVILAGLVMGGFLAFAVQRTIRARRLPARTGWEEMVGAIDGSSKGNGMLAVMVFSLILGAAITTVPEKCAALIGWLAYGERLYGVINSPKRFVRLRDGHALLG